MTTVQDVVKAATQLTPVEQLEIIQALSHALQQQYSTITTTAQQKAASPQPRIAGLDRGDYWMSDDFDAELPDEFWLGGDDELVA